MSHHLVEVSDLSYRYPDGTDALRGVSFRVVHGESVAVVGANGAGKSTLLMHLNGTLPPTAGRVLVGEVPVGAGTAREVRRTVGMVFANPDDQLFMPTVADDVAFGPLNLGLPVEDVERRVRESLQKVEALHLAERPPYRLSSGEKRIAAIAAVLAMQPDMSHGQWLLVTLTAGVGGSLLSVGSAAGVAVMGQARGIYRFFAHLKWAWAIALGYAASIWVHFLINQRLFHVAGAVG